MDKKGQVITEGSFWIFVLLVVIISLIFGEGKISTKLIIFLLFSIIINPIFSFFIHSWLNSFNLDWLDEINIEAKIFGYEISLTIYWILTWLILLFLFK